ncbi:MAG: amidohydrolase [Candidatus Heimdallarchaeota archaeon]|nr:amidohydrolase [Candidatus Heimdallarchaeota archaeon]
MFKMKTEIDLIVFNGNIITLNEQLPQVEALAIDQGKILALGKNEEIKSKFPFAKDEIDLKGKFLCPGFNDTHTHLLAVAAKFQDVLLQDVTSPKEALEKISQRVKQTPTGKWIFGEGWDESNWDEKRYLTLDELDKIAPENPCFIRRVCGHLTVVNTRALVELEISLDDPDLEFDHSLGKPTGVLTETLNNRVGSSPKLQKTQEDFDLAVKTACEYAHSLGVTSITDNLTIQQVKAYIKAWKKNELSVRVYMNIPFPEFDHYLATGLKTGFGNEILRLGGVKNFTDGSLGARTAKLKEAYFDDPLTRGSFYTEKAFFSETIKKAINNDWQTANHAIGDEAIEMVISVFEEINDVLLITKGRHRIEHAEYLTDDLLKRANKLGLILSMQPNFPGRWGRPNQLYEYRLGSERYRLLNRFRTIIDSKARLCFGSDNMPMNPIFGIWSVVTHPIDDIKISIDEALYYFTLGAAFSSFEESIKGSIEVGKVADLVVLDKDLYKIDPDAIKDVQVHMTFFNGKIVYKKATNFID